MIIRIRACTIRNERRIALMFGYDDDVITLVKQIEGRKWSASRKFWHIPYSSSYLEKLNNHFKGNLEFFENKSEKKKIKKNVKLPTEYIETLKLKNYSEPTIKTYRLHFQRFLNYYPEIELEDINYEQIGKYFL